MTNPIVHSIDGDIDHITLAELRAGEAGTDWSDDSPIPVSVRNVQTGDMILAGHLDPITGEWDEIG